MAVVAYVELKNELGIRGDGGLQGALSLRKYVAQEHVESLVITPVLPHHGLRLNSTMVYGMRRVVRVSSYLLLVLIS